MITDNQVKIENLHHLIRTLEAKKREIDCKIKNLKNSLNQREDLEKEKKIYDFINRNQDYKIKFKMNWDGNLEEYILSSDKYQLIEDHTCYKMTFSTEEEYVNTRLKGLIDLCICID